MKRLFLSLFVVVCLTVFTTSLFAGGDKVRGENGEGEVNQVNFNAQGNQN